MNSINSFNLHSGINFIQAKTIEVNHVISKSRQILLDKVDAIDNWVEQNLLQPALMKLTNSKQYVYKKMNHLITEAGNSLKSDIRIFKQASHELRNTSIRELMKIFYKALSAPVDLFILTSPLYALVLAVFIDEIAVPIIVSAFLAVSSYSLMAMMVRGLYSIKIRLDFQDLLPTTHHHDNAALIVTPPEDQDHNGAIEFMTDQQLDCMRVLGNRLALFKTRAVDIDAINQNLKEMRMQNKRIRLLWINAHGSRDDLLLGKIIDQASVAKIQFSLLEPDATIVLAACDTGASGRRVNFAERVKWAAGPQHTVIAANMPCTSYTVTESTSGFDIKLYLFGYDVTVKPTEATITPKIIKEMTGVSYCQILRVLFQSTVHSLMTQIRQRFSIRQLS